MGTSPDGVHPGVPHHPVPLGVSWAYDDGTVCGGIPIPGMGSTIGGTASGRVSAGGKADDPVHGWINPTSVLGGVLAVVMVAYLSAVYPSGIPDGPETSSRPPPSGAVRSGCQDRCARSSWTTGPLARFPVRGVGATRIAATTAGSKGARMLSVTADDVFRMKDALFFEGEQSAGSQVLDLLPLAAGSRSWDHLELHGDRHRRHDRRAADDADPRDRVGRSSLPTARPGRSVLLVVGRRRVGRRDRVGLLGPLRALPIVAETNSQVAARVTPRWSTSSRHSPPAPWARSHWRARTSRTPSLAWPSRSRWYHRSRSSA